ncbi:MAG: recombinase family protein [Defluviitaleaceae bacterium]|nr:recombinase family protein [Defluviitaleaceae bacterium]
MEVYGYCRVSTAEQNENRQLDVMTELKVPQSHIFVDKQSGKDFERPAWKSLVGKLQHGDLLYIHSIDRLGRNYGEIQNWWRILTREKGVDIVVLDMELLDARKGKDLLGTLIADLVLNLFSYVAHNEHPAIRKRQQEGIAAAKARGVRFGRPTKKPPEDFALLAKQWERGKLRTKDFMERTDLSETTLYRRLREHNARRKK